MASRSESSTEPCKLCQRRTLRGTTEHHLIPRMCHSNKWFKKNFSRDQMRQTISVCRDCHGAIHRYIPKQKVLGRDFNTVEKLLAHDELAKFVRWVSKQV
ncbi:hypothetical protein [Stieleria varia]|uniref:HNH domain-containing protein n=1 Tax=Stieleria varia TaxID=2528005 RepID=A0A5C6AT09_9BACT|nr:hypothetical protein [Stieleria varia]TWU02688.1 hypothetical protein Pla52n_37460 [Stieleria varia]